MEKCIFSPDYSQIICFSKKQIKNKQIANTKFDQNNKSCIFDSINKIICVD